MATRGGHRPAGDSRRRSDPRECLTNLFVLILLEMVSGRVVTVLSVLFVFCNPTSFVDFFPPLDNLPTVWRELIDELCLGKAP